MSTPEKLGRLIVIEGIDGTGKSTQVRMLAEALRAEGHEVVQSFEPTNGTWGRQLRESATTGRLSIEQELDYFLKDRKEHVETLIAPTIQRGGIVILDRYYFSSMAYQGARGIDPQSIREQNEVFAPQPDLLLILDLNVDLALKRVGVRDGEANEFEQKEALQFCRDLFLTLENESFSTVIDVDHSIDEIHKTILSTVHRRLS
ncbi:MAG: dTMP kinase [Akkermansiaceae bacterium]